MTGRGAAPALAGCALAVFAAQAQPPWQVEVGAGRDTLSGGRPPWTQFDAALRHTFAPRATVEVNARRTERFDLVDREIGASIAAPLGEAWSGSLSAASSPTHRVLPHGHLGAGVQRALDGGWVLGAALKRNRYDSAHSTGLTLGVERYVGAWRGAAALIHTRVSGGRSTDGVRLQLDHYIGERGQIGVIVSAGREIDDLGVAELTVSDVETVALVGRWKLAPGWGLVGDVGTSRVGSLYRRSGGRLGVQFDF